MDTGRLIASLAEHPLRPGRPAGRIAAALVAGAILALAALWLAFGSPIALVAARWSAASAWKVLYPASIAALAASAALQAGRPGANARWRALLILAPVVAVAWASLIDLFAAPAGRWPDLLFGSTLVTCLASVALTSAPVFAGLLWAFRLLAPVEPRTAGFLVGLASGGSAAAAYAFYCPELTPAFLLGAYTPAMLIPAIAGAIAGPRLLRW